jgi:hypothetical protein
VAPMRQTRTAGYSKANRKKVPLRPAPIKAARACAMGRTIPFHVPLAPLGIGKAEVRSQERVRIMNSE